MTEPVLSLKATGRSRRRLLVNRIAEGSAMLAAALAVGALALVVWAVFIRGVGALNVDFFIKGPPQFGQTGGGIAPAIVGTLMLVAIATAIALPFGVLTALYVSEFAQERIGRQIRLWLDVLNGFPSIVIGIFVFTIIVKAPLPIVGSGHHQSAIAGGFALSIIMLPLVARSTMEVLRARSESPPRGELRAGRLQVADGHSRRSADVLRRDPHRHDARDRPCSG